jgi:hypothetical protein
LIMDNADPRWVWYAAGLVGGASAGVYLILHRRVDLQGDQPLPAASLPALPGMLEE